MKCLIIGPTILASRGIGKLGMAGHARTGAAALKGNKAAKALNAQKGEDKAFKYFAGTLGTGAGGGVLVDQLFSTGKRPQRTSNSSDLLNTPERGTSFRHLSQKSGRLLIPTHRT